MRQVCALAAGRFTETSEQERLDSDKRPQACVKSKMKRWRRTAFLPAALMVFALSLNNLYAQSADSADKNGGGCVLRVHVDGLRSSKGVVGSALFVSAVGWPDQMSKSFRNGPTPIIDGARDVMIVWNNVPAGDYGLVTIHDENSNAHLDRNLFGIPKEGFGFANNPHVVLAPPAFKAAIVHVMCPVTESNIHLQYK